MKRLTFKEPSGKWGIVGMNADNENEKVYSCLSKLLDYEKTGLEPADIIRLKSKIEDMEENLQTIEKELGQLKSKICVRATIQQMDEKEESPAEKAKPKKSSATYRIKNLVTGRMLCDSKAKPIDFESENEADDFMVRHGLRPEQFKVVPARFMKIAWSEPKTAGTETKKEKRC